MQPIRAIIIDDEKNSRDTLRLILNATCPHVEIIAEANNAATGKTAIATNNPDLVFLDIQMPGGTGFDMLQSMTSSDFAVIFTTAYDEYAVKAFKFSALDYLLKPIHPADLQQAVEKLNKKEKETTILGKQLDLLKDFFASNSTGKKATPTDAILPEQKIALPTMEGIHFVTLKDIIWCEAMAGYTRFHILNTSPVIVSRLLKDYEEILNPHFFVRVHHSSLINIRHIKKYVKGEGGQVWMNDGTEIEVSRRKKEELLTRLAKVNIAAGK